MSLLPELGRNAGSFFQQFVTGREKRLKPQNSQVLDVKVRLLRFMGRRVAAGAKYPGGINNGVYFNRREQRERRRNSVFSLFPPAKNTAIHLRSEGSLG